MTMSPVASMTAGLQLISSWLMSMLAVLAIMLSVIVGILFVEFIVERGAFAWAYTVKTGSSDDDISSTSNTNN
jgi:hypothetical protein